MGRYGANIILILILLIIAACSSKEREQPPPEFSTYFMDSIFVDLEKINREARTAQIDDLFSRMAENHWFNGSVLYMEKDRLVYSKSFGYESFRRKDPLTSSSCFQLASVSKMFTAMAIMLLKEDGVLAFDDSVQRFIPEFPYHGVTIRHLLTHRSGLSRYMSLAHNEWENKDIPLTNEDVIDLFTRYRPDPYFRPDNGFHYCNTNYALLASVVERATGITFDRFVYARIFRPLGMEHSFVYNMNGDSAVPSYITKGVPGHRYRRWRLIEERNEYLNGVMGDKGIYTCIDDLVKWDQALDHHLLVSEETMREAYTRGSASYWKRKDNYGFGWRIRESEDSTVFHFGWWKGFRTFYIKDLKNQKTLIVLTNKDKGPGSSHLWNILHDPTYDLGPVCYIPSK